ncbi:MAG TPA: TIGR03620 family F420-dependent LLM class oxidoreductase [Candidatus Binataceae bacterium]|nr:TIGR03620 family F420-dependent LLM class oxidoreductase [Candidatus Binataceae bacterium]
MEIGKLGAFCFMDAMAGPESLAFCRRVERMGYKVLWSPEAWGRETFAHGGYLLGRTDSLIYATGIANVWARDPMTMAAAAKTLAEIAPDRFILGIGVSHRSLVEDLHGHPYAKPFSYLSDYIPRMKSAFYNAVAPKVEPPLVIAALHPKSLGLAAREAQGTHTYLCLPPHTTQARTLMGPDKWVCASVTAILERDATKARARAREHLSFYANQDNYRRILIAQGFAAADFEHGGSDRLIDAVIAWGSEDKIKERIDAHLAAGANHVCLLPLRGDHVSLPDERVLEAFAPR